MKRLNVLPAIFLMMLLFASQFTMAQKRTSESQVFDKGTVTVSLGVGSGIDYKNVNDNATFGTKAALEVGIWQAGPGVISLGAEIGGAFSSGGKYNDFRSSTLVVAGRSAWHHGWKVKRLDTYAGISAGVGFHHHDYNNGNSVKLDQVIPVFSPFIGASYFFTPSFGANIEAGRNINAIQVGLIFKHR